MQHARIGNRNPGVGDESIAGDKPLQRIQPHGTDLLADGFDAAAGEPSPNGSFRHQPQLRGAVHHFDLDARHRLLRTMTAHFASRIEQISGHTAPKQCKKRIFQVFRHSSMVESHPGVYFPPPVRPRRTRPRKKQIVPGRRRIRLFPAIFLPVPRSRRLYCPRRS